MMALWQRTIIDPIAFYTLLLAFFSGALVVVSFIQIRLLVRSDLTARIVVDLTEKQILLAGGQADLAAKQHALARMQFIADKRPRLRVRYFRLMDTRPNEPVDIRFAIVNVGGSAAEIVGSKGTIGFFSDGRPLPAPNYGFGNPFIEPRKFEVGASDEGLIFGSQTKSFSTAQHDPLTVFGYLVYKDLDGNTRTTAFCRRYNAGHERFEHVEDSDYDYED